MASRAQARGLQGVTQLRRKLRRIHEQTENTLKPVIADVAEAIKQDAIARVPKDTGDLAAAIEQKVSPDGLTAIIGPAVKMAQIRKLKNGSVFSNKGGVNFGKGDKKLLFQFFKGYWIEFGTKGSEKRGIPAQPARPFMGPAFDVNKEWAKGRVRDEINKTLKKVAQSE